MAYNFLGLVNDVNQRLNEVKLTSANFDSAGDVYPTIKEAVNASIRHINQDQYQWPFNYVSQEDTLVAGTMRYPYPVDAKIVDFNTFRIQRNDTFGNETQYLRRLDYEQFLQNDADLEYNTNTNIRELPKYVCRTPGQEYLVTPPPDKAYEVTYEYYSLPVNLELYSDVPTIPQAFRHIIIDGAMYYLYLFRSDIEASDRIFPKFIDGINNMKAIYINRHDYVRDTRIHRNTSASSGYRDID